MLEALQRWFGYSHFREGQEEVVRRILDGEDLCVVMPTGAGKSLCYQLPTLMRPGYGLVVSPLISLMRDQVEGLRGRGIAATCINSTLSAGEQNQVLRDVWAGEAKILYVAPERFRIAAFQRLLQDCPPTLFVIDEAHCISQWGHDFRPDYLTLGPTAEALRIPQICAFTATATPRVREDIRVRLKRPGMGSVVTGFQRPNLAFRVLDCPADAAKLGFLEGLSETPCPTIVYSSTRKMADSVAATLGGICYHAGLSAEVRHRAQSRFMDEACPLLVATNAFGMGIDRPDIRRVVHYNLPGSLEAYYQEAGRAGRDGEPAECVLLFAYRDRFIQEFLIDLNNPPAPLLRSVYDTVRSLCERLRTTVLELTHAELAEVVPGDENATSIGSCLRMLEKHGALRRGYRRAGAGTLRFLRDPTELRLVHQHESTQRSRFLHRMAVHMGPSGQPAGEFSLEQLSRLCGLRSDQVRRVLRALQDDALSWTPPFAGATVELIDPARTELDVDAEAIERKRTFEIERLDEVIAYTRGQACRQQFLVNYFGQDVGPWRCGRCDCCTGFEAQARELSPLEMTTVKTVLATVMSLEGGFGKARVAAMLAAPLKERLGAADLDVHPQRASLVHLGKAAVRSVVDALMRAGCIGTVGEAGFPCIDITPQGLRVLDGDRPLRLDLPPPRSSSRTRAQRPARPTPGRTPPTLAQPPGADLMQALQELRSQIAARRRVQPYRVMSNATLEILAQKRPTTVEEALHIKGIGPVKARTIIPEFLRLIQLLGTREG